MLVGQAPERARVDELLANARTGASGAVIVHGDPGIGKSTLLDYVVSRADGFDVFRTQPLEAEVELPFAGLSDLVRPLLPLLESLPEPQAAALSAALALGPPAPGDRFAVAAATLSLLAAGAEDTPILVAVDDAHWLDQPSREALLFAARRLGREGVLVVLATRDRPWLERAGIEQLKVSGLTEDEVRALIDVSTRVVSPHVRERLLADTGGNPLAILQALDALSDGQLAGAEMILGPLPVGDDLGHGFARRLEPLRDETRAALLVAAASDTGDRHEIESALTTLGLEPEMLAGGAGEGLISIGATSVEFSHPLVRSAVYYAAEPEERHAAHRALAETLPPEASDRIAWHLAGAAGGPNEEVAALLEASADSAQARLGYASAAVAYETAARLSPADADRLRRTLAAAQAFRLGGSPDRADALLLPLVALAGDPLLRADIQLLRGAALFFTAPVRELYVLLSTEAERVAPVDAARAATMLAQAAGLAMMTGEPLRLSTDTARRAYELAQPLPGPLSALTAGVLGGCLLMSGKVEEATALLEPLVPMLDLIDPLGEASSHIAFIAQNLSWLGDLERAEGVLERLIQAARLASAPSLLPFPLSAMAEHQLRRGRVAAARASAAEAVRLAAETGQVAPYPFIMLARAEAQLGLEEECREHVATARAVARGIGSNSIELYAEGVLAQLGLCLANLEEAYAHAAEAARLAGEIGVGLPELVPLRPDLIEAAIRLGRLDDAARELEVLEGQARATGLEWGAATAARCRGMSDDESTYEATFAEALVLHGGHSPLERARTELCLGRRRRHSRRRADARESLRAALATFESLGAEPWAEQARAELRATGVTVTPRDDSTLRDLTPQELQVALIVAQGATTKQAAASLFLSPKTIEFHLGNVYRKLGIRSRTELVRRVEHLDAAREAEPAALA